MDVMEGIGWKVRGDFFPPESKKRGPFFPRFMQALYLIPMILRFVLYAINEWWNGRKVFIDITKQLKHYPYTAVPIGGIGCGAMGTDFRGAFNKFSLRPGLKEHTDNIKGDQFILSVHSKEDNLLLQTTLSCADFDEKPLSTWKSTVKKENVRYRGLFPRAWREFSFPELSLVLICEQMSPIIPHDYEVQLGFAFESGTGNKKWNREGCRFEPLSSPNLFGANLLHTINKMPVTYTVAVQNDKELEVSVTHFRPNGDGAAIWNALAKQTKLKQLIGCSDDQLGVFVSSSILVASGSDKNINYALSWHMPIVRFGASDARALTRRYVRFMGNDSETPRKLVEKTFKESEHWRREIEKWQSPVVHDDTLPEWYRSALFNELYYICDGSNVWFEYDSSWKQQEASLTQESIEHLEQFGRFGYMESWEYFMFNTYDVHYYASWALMVNWPQLELSIQMNFCDQVYHVDNRRTTSLKGGERMDAKIYARIPHDVGHPVGEPWVNVNAYILHDSAHWRDLNLKFVMNCWRDYKMIIRKNNTEKKSLDLLAYFYERCVVIVESALDEWDTDNDGMIENSGTADQTYDVWTMTGTSAYCGSLWLSTLFSVSQMAKILGHTESNQRYRQLLQKATKVFVEKLWNGRYFKFDSQPENAELIMADQLCGIWFQTIMQEESIIDEKMIISSLKTVFDKNVKSFANGSMGPVNGIRESGEIDISSIQSEEVWTGTAYALASFMIDKGLRSEGFKTARGVYESCWERFGLQYQTPEAVYKDKYYRALGYMRPLSIWAIHYVLNRKK